MDTVDDLLDRARLTRDLPPPSMRRAIREAAGLSMADVAGPLGVTAQAVSLWELGLRFPRGARLAAYAELLMRLREEVDP